MKNINDIQGYTYDDQIKQINNNLNILNKNIKTISNKTYSFTNSLYEEYNEYNSGSLRLPIDAFT